MKGRNLKIDWWPADEVPQLQGVIDEHWRNGHVLARDAELLRWQYRHPTDPSVLSVLRARDEEGLAGVLGTNLVDFSVQGRRTPGVWLALWFNIKHAAAGTGLMLLRAAMEGDAKVVACLGFNDIAERIYRGLRFTVIEELPRWICLANADAFRALLEMEQSHAAADLQATVAALSHDQSRHTTAAARLIAWDEGLADRWNAKWDHELSKQCIGTWRNFDYLRWRYAEHPRFQYQLLFAEDAGGAISGLVVFRYERVAASDLQVVRILELLGNEDACALLAAAVREKACAAGAAFADFFCTRPGIAAPLTEAGFHRERSLPATIPMLFQPLDHRRTRVRLAYSMLDGALEAAATAHPETLYVTRSDGDQDRPN
ncbi:MAG TPA: hypothetical protein VHD36_15395 [Pirellulales bacterium]|nr:hypothetical protein [Pirellulales bacterium]